MFAQSGSLVELLDCDRFMHTANAKVCQPLTPPERARCRHLSRASDRRELREWRLTNQPSDESTTGQVNRTRCDEFNVAVGAERSRGPIIRVSLGMSCGKTVARGLGDPPMIESWDI